MTHAHGAALTGDPQWGIAFAAPMSGATLVLPGNALDGESIYNLLQNERVTVTAAVPTGVHPVYL